MENNDKKSILVVEDDTALRKVLLEKLTAEGFIALGALNGEDGLKTALDKHPALILLDVFMPVMDGITMLSKLRSSGSWGKHVTVLILTNSSIDAQTIAKVSGLGATDYMIKSEWSLDALIGRIHERLA